MKVTVLTLGCKANQAESFEIEADLRSRGCSIVEIDERPDVCVVNTCSVTAKSDCQSRQMIRRAAKAGSRVVVTGCYSELNRDLVQKMEGVDGVVNIRDKTSIPMMLSKHISCATSCHNSPSRSRFFLKVQDGCDNSCSYCIIPAARGGSRSVSPAVVVDRVGRLSELYNEIVLTGIQLGPYGDDLVPKVSLSDLLAMLLQNTKISRIRISSLEIGEIDDKLLEVMRDERICKHLHIPLQSGDDRILRLMKRRYTSVEFQRGIDRITQKIPGVALGTDVIAGFPGEGEDEFRSTVELLEALPLSYLHAFPFSPRKDTPAARMDGAADARVSRVRCSLLREIGACKKAGFMCAQIGRELDLLVEEVSGPGRAVGTTGNYLKLEADLSETSLKTIVPVRVEGIDNGVLVGHAIGAV
jgi:threonylcarbamoyladenosine tRNA methylthiotransferase MtaB